MFLLPQVILDIIKANLADIHFFLCLNVNVLSPYPLEVLFSKFLAKDILESAKIPGWLEHKVF